MPQAKRRSHRTSQAKASCAGSRNNRAARAAGNPGRPHAAAMRWPDRPLRRHADRLNDGQIRQRTGSDLGPPQPGEGMRRPARFSRASHGMGNQGRTERPSADIGRMLTCTYGMRWTGWTPGMRLGVKGSRVQIPPSRPEDAGQRPLHQPGEVATRSFDRTLTAGYGGILRYLVDTGCGERHTPTQYGVNIRRLRGPSAAGGCQSGPGWL